MTKKVCNVLFNGMEISTSGRIRPCCLFTRYLSNTAREFALPNDSLDDVFNSDDLNELRRKSLAGEHIPECEQCFSEEQAGSISKRMRESSKVVDYDNPKIQQLDIKTGNTCNLKCVICNPFHSSKFNSENKQLGLETANKSYAYNWNDRRSVWTEIEEMADDLTHLDFMGGEPMLDKEHAKLLQYLVSSGKSKKITLNYVTNGTIVNGEVIDMFKFFKHVSIVLSADGIGRAFEYCRFPGKWNDFERNLEMYRSLDVGLVISYSVSMYSLFDLFDALDYYATLNVGVWLNFVYYGQDISIFPEHIKEQFIAEYENRKSNWTLTENSIDSVIEFMNRQPHDLVKWNEFLSITDRRDSIRNLSFKNNTHVPL